MSARRAPARRDRATIQDRFTIKDRFTIRDRATIQGRTPQRGAAEHDDRGAVAVLAAVLIVAVLLPLTAIVINLGMARYRVMQAQNAADAASLAAAIEMRYGSGDTSTATAKAAQLVAANLDASVADCSSASAAHCTVSYTSGTVTVTLAGLVGVPSAGMSSTGASSTAGWRSQWGTCVLCIAGDVNFGWYSRRTYLTAHSGSIGITGDAGTWISWQYGSLNADGAVQVHGGVSANVISNPAIVPGPATIDEPYAGVVTKLQSLIDATPLLAHSASSGICGSQYTVSGVKIGVYKDDLSDCSGFESGVVYVLVGTSTSDPTDHHLTSANANGVLFYATCGREAARDNSGTVYATSCKQANGHDPYYYTAGRITPSKTSGKTITGYNGGGASVLQDVAIVEDPDPRASYLNWHSDTWSNRAVLGSGTSSGNLTINGIVYLPGPYAPGILRTVTVNGLWWSRGLDATIGGTSGSQTHTLTVNASGAGPLTDVHLVS